MIQELGEKKKEHLNDSCVTTALDASPLLDALGFQPYKVLYPQKMKTQGSEDLDNLHKNTLLVTF